MPPVLRFLSYRLVSLRFRSSSPELVFSKELSREAERGSKAFFSFFFSLEKFSAIYFTSITFYVLYSRFFPPQKQPLPSSQGCSLQLSLSSCKKSKKKIKKMKVKKQSILFQRHRRFLLRVLDETPRKCAGLGVFFFFATSFFFCFPCVVTSTSLFFFCFLPFVFTLYDAHATDDLYATPRITTKPVKNAVKNVTHVVRTYIYI